MVESKEESRVEADLGEVVVQEAVMGVGMAEVAKEVVRAAAD